MNESQSLHRPRRRKRSNRISLAAMGLSSLALGGCGNPEPPIDTMSFSEAQTYRSVDECIAANVFTPTACEQAHDSAMQEAPRFETLEACEASQGEDACVSAPAPAGATSGSGDWFMPALMGYMVGTAMMNSARGTTSLHHVYHEPIYRDRRNRGDWDAAVSGASTRVNRRNDALQKSVQEASRARAQRSGFASRSSARGSWGS